MSIANKPSRQQLNTIAKGDPALLRALEALFNVDTAVTQAEFDALEAVVEGVEKLAGAGDARGAMTGLPVQTDYVDFGRGAFSPMPRRMGWNANDGTVDVGLNANVTLQVGQELHFFAKNTSGADIPNGSAVMFTGTVGASGKLTFGLAVANGSQPPQYMMGITTEDIPDNGFGYVTSFGLIRGMNATGGNKTVPEVWADGDILYFDPAYAGELTNVQPIAPNLDLPVAVVIHAASGGSGSIFVRMKTGERVQDLHDVFAPTPSNGARLAYSTANSRWEAQGGTVVLAGDVINNNAVANTAQDVTGLSFPVVSGGVYEFEAVIQYDAAATSTGSRWAINGPAASLVSVRSQYALTTTTETVNYVNGYNLPAASNISSAATTGNIARLQGFVTPSVDGSVIVRFASEVSGSAITAKAGSILRWERVA